MSSAERPVAVVIPSTGLRERAPLLMRAINSVLEQRGVRGEPIVVLNGASRAPEVERALQGMSAVRMIILPVAGIGPALRAGREAVSAEYFGTLDDDDVLMPNALAMRLKELDEHPDVDVVVTNGLVSIGGTTTLHMRDNDNVGKNPVLSLARRNWLLPGSWMARCRSISPSIFAGMPRYRECTFLAMRIATQYKMHWLQQPTVVWHADSPQSISQSRAYLVGQVEALHELRRMPLPTVLRLSLRWRVAAAYHQNSDLLWREGLLIEAWQMHWKSLFSLGGLRFLPFSRHLLSASVRKSTARRTIVSDNS